MVAKAISDADGWTDDHPVISELRSRLQPRKRLQGNRPKADGPQLMDHLTALFLEMWRQEEVPQDFKDATILHLYKRKGNRQLCENYGDISFLNTAGKIFTRILLNRLKNHLEQGLLLESQSGFRRYSGTTDMILAAPRQLHNGMIPRVTDNEAVTEAFAGTNGVKQGCVLAPFLFIFMFSATMKDTCRDERPGIRMAYRTDGHLLNQRRMHFRSRVSTTTVHELLFADDCAFNATSEGDMHRSMDLFAAACNTDADAVYIAPQINVNGAHLQVLNSFIYLGSTPFRTTKIGDEVAHRISKASQVFGLLQSTVWNQHGLHLGTELKMHKAVILPTPLILKLKWQDRIPHMNVLGRMGIVGVCALLRQLKLSWSGHLVRMDDKRLPNRFFYGYVDTGLRRQVGQVRCYKGALKTSLRRLQINPINWEEIARDRPTWWSAVETDAVIYETNRITASKAKRKSHRPRLPSPHNINSQPPPTCARRSGRSQTLVSLIRHLQTNCITRTAPHDAPPPTSAPPPRR
nr:unnamed protein product [Spirometra erinaceieuropaei]